MALTLAEYKVQVDWNNDGGFGGTFPYWFPFFFGAGDTIDDISADAKEMTWERGRDTELDKTETGMASIAVKDTTGKYVPQNTVSPLYPLVLPARPVRIRALHNGVVYNLYRGFLDDIFPEPHIEDQRATLPCLDGLDLLARAKISMPLQIGKLSGQLVTEALDQAAWDATMRAIDAGLDTYPLVYAERQGCRNFLDNLSLSEFGFFYVDGQGYLAWEDRSHRLLGTHQVSQWVCSADKYTNIEPMNSLKLVRNVIIIDAQPYLSSGVTTDLWKLQENKDNPVPDSPLLAAGEVVSYWAKFDSIAENVLTLVASTDYLGNTAVGGGGVDKTAQLNVTESIFAQSAQITVTNTDPAAVYLTLLKIRGDLFTKPERLEVVAEDATSISEYGERHLPITLPYYPGSRAMQNQADYQLGTKKDPWNSYRITLIGSTDEILEQILLRKLSDRITVQNATYNIDDDFFIDKVEHQVMEDGIHKCRWTLSRADDMIYWIWDVSKWDVSTRWGY